MNTPKLNPKEPNKFEPEVKAEPAPDSKKAKKKAKHRK